MTDRSWGILVGGLSAALCGIAASLPAGTGGALSVASASAITGRASTTPGLTPLIPAYYPATGTSTDPWQTVPPAALSNKTPAVEVMNADSGPGTNIGITDPTASGLAAYQVAITTAHTYGSRVYGYIWTNYANAGSGPAAPISTIETEIDQWVTYYPGIDGVFFDGTSTQTSGVSFYETIDTYATSMGLKAIFNPGAVPAQSYMSIDPTSIVVDFEGTGATYTRTSFPSWTASYAPARFANLVYATGSGSVSTIASRARKNNVGNLYVTDGTLPNAWGQLASYFFRAELPALAPKYSRNVALDRRALRRVGARIRAGARCEACDRSRTSTPAPRAAALDVTWIAQLDPVSTQR